MARKMLGTLVVALYAILLQQPVSASFHLMKIVEVFPGTSAEPTAQYIMLQMYFPGQTFVAGHFVEIFDATGTMLGSFSFANNVANGANLATILIATPDAATLFGVSADLTMTPVIPAGGGAVCYDVIDCVSWGSFSGTVHPSPGTPFNAPTGLVLGMAMHRNLSSGGAVTNFAFAPPAPKNNAGTSGMVATPTPTAAPTPVVTPSLPACVGDCDGSGDVTVDELLLMVNVALETADVSTCLAGDADHDGTIVINEILAAVVNALNGCPASPEQQGCLNSGGTVTTKLCCTGAPAFPGTCAIGSCGCSPQSSSQVSFCDCGASHCFDRTQQACVPGLVATIVQQRQHHRGLGGVQLYGNVDGGLSGPGTLARQMETATGKKGCHDHERGG